MTDEITARTGYEENISSDEMSDLFDQFKEWMTAQAESGGLLVEQLPGCRIPGCQCEGRIKDMEWGSVDMTETDDSEYEDPDDRANRLYVESCNYDLSKGMTPKTATPPLRRKNNGQELHESTSCASELESQTDEVSLNSEPTVQPGTARISPHMEMREILMDPLS